MEMHTSESLRATHGLDVRASAGASLIDWVSGLLSRMREAGRLRRDYELLMSKSERELDDIGLTRADVIAAFEYGRWGRQSSPKR